MRRGGHLGKSIIVTNYQDVVSIIFNVYNIYMYIYIFVAILKPTSPTCGMLVRSFDRLVAFVRSCVRSLVRSFDRSLDGSFARSFVRPFLRAFAHSLVRSFARWPLLLLTLVVSIN